AMIMMVVIYAIGYRKVPPNNAMVLFRGRPDKGGEAVYVIQGGGRFMLPGSGNYVLLEMDTDLVEFQMTGVPTKSEGGPVTLRLNVATIWRIVGDNESLLRAAGTLINKTRGENEMSVKGELEKAITNLCRGYSWQAVQSDSDLVKNKVTEEANQALAGLGLEIMTTEFLKIRPQGA
ncbi:MAG: SPFH domain-containing protein, partial [Thermoplasmata archaeon]